MGELLSVLVLPPEIFQPILIARNPEDALKAWHTQLPDIKRHWRKRVLETHPDKGGKAEHFRLVQRAWEILQQDEFALALWRKTHVAMPHIRIYVSFGPYDSTSTGSTSTISHFPSVFEMAYNPPPFTRR